MIETRLHEILSLQRPLLFFDLETTGPNALADRIVEIGLIQIKPDGTIKPWRTLVDPEMPIPPGSTEKHGITDADVQGCSVCKMERGNEQHLPGCPDDAGAHDFKPWPKFRDIAPNLKIGFSNTDFAGFNAKTFDLPCMKAEFGRNGITWDFVDAYILDGFRLWQLADPRTLSDFYRRWAGKELEHAHSADADIAATVEGVEALLRQVMHLPRSLDALHALQWPERAKNPNALDETGKFQWIDGKAIIAFGKHKGTDMKLVPRKYYEFMLDAAAGKNPKFVMTDFPGDALQIMRDLLVGKWPEKPKEAASNAGTETLS